MRIEFNKTYTQTIEGVAFGGLPQETLVELFKDGRIFSHFAERILARDFQQTHVGGCKAYDLVDPVDSTIIYDQKTFTANGCGFMSSSMKGTGRSFDKEKFDETAKGLIYIVVSNVKFPEIKIRFVKGEELAHKYPRGEIPFKDHDTFFRD